MSLLALITRSHDKQRKVEAIVPTRPLSDADKAIHGLEVLIRQCEENPLQAYIDWFGCGIEKHTELNKGQRALLAEYQTELENDLNNLLKSM